MKKQSFGMTMALISVMALALNGCAVRLVKRSPYDVEEIERLKEMTRLKSDEVNQLQHAKAELERQLAQEIQNKQVKVGLDERGLVITFVDEVLFDSGKAKIRTEAYPTLSKVAGVLNGELATQPVAIEGHTDNEPIKHSGWKSNWELSTARATSVLHYLVDEQHVSPERARATGFGEYRPVASNATREGRQQNRRVEVVVLPGDFTKVPASELGRAAEATLDRAAAYHK